MEIKILLLKFAILSLASSDTFVPLSDDLINFINSQTESTWKAGRSGKSQGGQLPYICKHSISSTDGIPECFDSRQKWPHCSTIGDIREQSNCGACWAFAAVEVLTDRFCIHSNGNVTPYLSAVDVLTCIEGMGGCMGGLPNVAWAYLSKKGSVTGGPTGCRPYPFAACSHNSNQPSVMCNETEWPATPSCVAECQPGYAKTYQEDKYYAKNDLFYGNDVESMQREIMTNGPIQAGMLAYEDFFVYQSGIYQHITGSLRYGHQVKIIGWGVENNVSFWLVANSYNPTWGDSGFFKILRGKNECQIESYITAGYPKLEENQTKTDDYDYNVDNSYIDEISLSLFTLISKLALGIILLL